MKVAVRITLSICLSVVALQSALADNNPFKLQQIGTNPFTSSLVPIDLASSGSIPSMETPGRDPAGEDWIIYDDGRADLYYVAANLWARVSFRPAQMFRLQAVSLLPLNLNNSEAPLDVFIYRENQQTRNLLDLVYSAHIDRLPDWQNDIDENWQLFELNEEDYIDFEAGETFSVVYGITPGGNMQQGADGYWIAIDGATRTRTSFVNLAQGGEPPNEHVLWIDGQHGAECANDILIRANGAFINEDADLALIGVSNGDGEDRTTGHWFTPVGEGQVLRANLVNFGSPIEAAILNFRVENLDGDAVFDWDTIIENIDTGDERIVECEEPCIIENHGLYRLFATIMVDNDLDPTNDQQITDLLIIDPENEAGWNGYVDVETEEQVSLEPRGDGFRSTLFDPPDLPGGFSVSSLRILVEGLGRQYEVPAAVQLIDLASMRVIDVIWEGAIGPTTEEEIPQWIEIAIDYEGRPPRATEDGQAFIITFQGDRPNMYSCGHPVAAWNALMPPVTMIVDGEGNVSEVTDEYDYAMEVVLVRQYPEEPGIIHVPRDYETINAAIEAAEDGDSILVSDGIYRENIFFLGKEIAVVGNIESPARVVIDGQAQDAVVTFANHEGPSSSLAGFTIRNGLQNFGGGIDCQGDSRPTLHHLIITGNRATQFGGGIYITGTAHPTISHTSFRNNIAERGGGIACFNSGALTGEYLEISGNTATNIGGGIYCVNNSFVELDHIAIVDNSAGGGWASGAYHRSLDGHVQTYTNATIAGNDNGGISFVADNEGEGSPAILTNCIISGNGGTDLSFDASELDGDDFPLTISYSLFSTEEENFWISDRAEMIDDGGNIEDDPLFSDPDNGDYHLTLESLCIDAGDPDYPPDPDGTRADMGAFYFPLDVAEVPLAFGWRLISTSVQPHNRDFPTIFRDILDRGNMLFLKDQEGRFFNPFAGENGYHNLDQWDSRQAYYVKMQWRDVLTVSGVRLAIDTPIPLRQGWNFAGYLPEVAMDVRDAFAGIHDQLLFVKNEHGQFWAIGNGYCNLPPIEPGRGLNVRVSEAVDLIYPAGGERVAALNDRSFTEARLPTHFTSVRESISNMSLLLQSEWLGNGVEGEFGVFTAEGLCVGSTVVSDGQTAAEGGATVGVAVWGDDPITPEIDGALEGELLSIRYWNGVDEVALDMRVTDGFEIEAEEAAETLRYGSDRFVIAAMALSSNAEPIVPTSFAVLALYPNPFNSSTRISYSVRQASLPVHLAIYDISGRLVTTLIDGRVEAGRHEAVWQSAEAPAGLYFVRLKAGNVESSQRLVIVK